VRYSGGCDGGRGRGNDMPMRRRTVPAGCARWRGQWKTREAAGLTGSLRRMPALKTSARSIRRSSLAAVSDGDARSSRPVVPKVCALGAIRTGRLYQPMATRLSAPVLLATGYRRLTRDRGPDG